MYPSVAAQFRAFNERFEGCISHMYLDVKGLVTIGVGNLIDPVEAAMVLPFRFKIGGAPASQEQIAAEWRKLKNDAALAQKGCRACAAITELELGQDAIGRLVAQRLARNEEILKRQPPFHEFDTWPADAQMGLLSMAWAMGAGGFAGFPRFSGACRSRNFRAAAVESKLREAGNPGLAPRNRADFVLFSNAAAVCAPGSSKEPATLYYPADLAQVLS